MKVNFCRRYGIRSLFREARRPIPMSLNHGAREEGRICAR